MSYQRLQTTDATLNRIQDSIEKAYRDLENLIDRSIPTGTPLNTSSTIVARDVSGNFAAGRGTFTGLTTSGAVDFGMLGFTGTHNIRGAAILYSRPTDNANIAQVIGFANSVGVTQAQIGLGAQTGAGLIISEFNNGLAFKSPAGIAFSGSNNRVDGSMDATGQWTLGDLSGSTAAVAVHKLVRGTRGLRVTIPIGNTSQTNPTVLEPNTLQDDEGMKISAGVSGANQSWIHCKGNWNGVTTNTGGIDFATKSAVIGQVNFAGEWLLGSQTDATAKNHYFFTGTNGYLRLIGNGATSAAGLTFQNGTGLQMYMQTSASSSADLEFYNKNGVLASRLSQGAIWDFGAPGTTVAPPHQSHAPIAIKGQASAGTGGSTMLLDTLSGGSTSRFIGYGANTSAPGGFQWRGVSSNGSIDNFLGAVGGNGQWDLGPNPGVVASFPGHTFRGVSNGSDAPTGYVGERVLGGNRSISPAPGWQANGTAILTITAGDWLITGTLHLVASASNNAMIYAGIAKDAAANSDNIIQDYFGGYQIVTGFGNKQNQISISLPFRCTTNISLYLKGFREGGNTDNTIASLNIIATRIR